MMDRLESIKGNLFPSRNSYENMTKLLNSDLEWLFKTIEQQQKEIEKLKAENQVLSNYKYMYEQARY